MKYEDIVCFYKKENEKLKKELDYLKSTIDIKENNLFKVLGESVYSFIILDTEKKVIYINYSAIKLFKLDVSMILDEKLPFIKEKIFNKVNINRKHKLKIKEENKKDLYLEIVISNIIWNEKKSYLLNIQDVTQNEIYKAKLKYNTHHDYLTHLYNRFYLRNVFFKNIEKYNKYSIVYCDLDKFKKINDNYGHNVGDLIIKLFAKSIMENLSKKDVAFRLGGDEFLICLLDNVNKDNIIKLLENIYKNLNKKSLNNSFNIQLNISFGVYVKYNIDDKLTFNDMINCADMAMYVSKRMKKNLNFEFYN